VKHGLIWEILEHAKVEDGALLPQLLKALGHSEKSIIIGASLVLGRLKDDRAVPSLIRAFLTTDQEVGSAVAWALGQCGSALAVPFLSMAVQKGFAVGRACEALGQIGNIDVLPLLLRTLSSQKDDERMFAAKALGQLAQKCNIQNREEISLNLVTLSADKSRKVRMSAVLALEKIRSR
jgi:hypothetical protein